MKYVILFNFLIKLALKIVNKLKTDGHVKYQTVFKIVNKILIRIQLRKFTKSTKYHEFRQ